MGSFPPNYEQRVADANQSGKIFRMSESYGAPRVRQALRERGYIEAKPVPYNSVYFNINCAMHTGQVSKKDLKEYEQVVIYRVIGRQTPHFVWVARQQHYHLYPSARRVNKIHITGLDFTVKDDLCRYTRHAKAMLGESQTGLKFTRNYNWHSDSRKVEESFTQDYRMGCILGLIQFLGSQEDLESWFVRPVGRRSSFVPDVETGNAKRAYETLGLKALDLSIHVLLTHIKAFEGLTSRSHVNCECDLNYAQWLFICRAFRLITSGAARFRADARTAERYIERVRRLADVIPDYWPERMLEGNRCVYLLKPVTSGNGMGILLLNHDRKIMNLATSKKRKYIIQKYIERPLLIYNTKFDIRQYFLITMDENKFRAWSHPLCTIKFATEEFTLDDLNESRHITNVTVQKRYKGRPRHPQLPPNNAWSISDLNQHLASERNQKSNIFGEVIYPAIKKCLTCIAELSFNHIEHENGRFELFGCDWLICEDYRTCLLEINRSPSLEYYTPIHADVVGTVLDDLVKVVIDFPGSERQEPSTGQFELLFESYFA